MASVQQFFAVPPPMPIMAFFRATSAAHQNCNVHSSPVLANSTTASDPAPPGDKFGWHLFAIFNRIAQEFFSTSKMRYLDIWTMSAQRPDGHSGWHDDQHDCLHVSPLSHSCFFFVVCADTVPVILFTVVSPLRSRVVV